jgi:hypothetical protein
MVGIYFKGITGFQDGTVVSAKFLTGVQKFCKNVQAPSKF